MGWGTTFPVGKDALRDASPVLFNGLRFLSAAVFAVGLLRRHGIAPLRRCLGWGVLLGALVASAFSLQSVGLTTIGPSRSAFLTAFYVPFTPFLEWLFTGRRPGLRAAAGIALAFSGGAVMTGVGSGTSPSWGDLATLACALLFAGHIVALSAALRRHPSEPLLFLQFLFCGVFCLAAAPLVETARVAWTAPFLYRLAFMSLFATVLVLWLQNYGQARASATRAAVLFATEPVWAAVFGAVLGERLGPAEFAGAALVLAGLVVASLPGRRKAAGPGDNGK